MAASKLRVGIIGIGWYALDVHVPNFRKIDNVEITAISRRNPERLALAQKAAQVAKVYSDWREMLANEALDAVVISTPHDAHTEPTLAALEHKLHVLLEKPMALTSIDARLMMQAAEQTDRVLTIGYNARGMGGWRAVKHALETNAIGQIRQITVVCCMDARFLWGEAPVPQELQELMTSSDPIAPFFVDVFGGNNWRLNPKQMGGGMFVDCGSHIVDILLWLGGAPASEVVAYTGTNGRAAESFVNCQGRLTNSATFSITHNDAVSGGAVPFHGNGRVTVFGDKGLLTADWTGFMTTKPEEVWIEREGEREKLEPLTDTFTPADGFMASILDGAPNMCSAGEAAQVVALVEAIYRSSAERRIIQIEPM